MTYDFEMIILKSYLERIFCVITLQGAGFIFSHKGY